MEFELKPEQRAQSVNAPDSLMVHYTDDTHWWPDGCVTLCGHRIQHPEKPPSTVVCPTCRTVNNDLHRMCARCVAADNGDPRRRRVHGA